MDSHLQSNTMNTMYNATALKKIKKAELVTMYLDLQAQTYDEIMNEVLEKCCNKAIEETVEELKVENEKLKEAIDPLTLGAKRTIESNCKLYQEIQELKQEIDGLKEEKEEKEEEVRGLESDYMENEEKIGLLEDENKKLKEEHMECIQAKVAIMMELKAVVDRYGKPMTARALEHHLLNQN